MEGVAAGGVLFFGGGVGGVDGVGVGGDVGEVVVGCVGVGVGGRVLMLLLVLVSGVCLCCTIPGI